MSFLMETLKTKAEESKDATRDSSERHGRRDG